MVVSEARNGVLAVPATEARTKAWGFRPSIHRRDREPTQGERPRARSEGRLQALLSIRAVYRRRSEGDDGGEDQEK